MYWVANEDVLQMKAIEKIPILDYYEILNGKFKQAKRQKEAQDKRERDKLLNRR